MSDRRCHFLETWELGTKHIRNLSVAHKKVMIILGYVKSDDVEAVEW